MSYCPFILLKLNIMSKGIRRRCADLVYSEGTNVSSTRGNRQTADAGLKVHRSVKTHMLAGVDGRDNRYLPRIRFTIDGKAARCLERKEWSEGGRQRVLVGLILDSSAWGNATYLTNTEWLSLTVPRTRHPTEWDI